MNESGLFERESRIVVTCNKRLAPWLEMEIRSLGLVPQRVFSTGVELRGTMKDCIRLNLNLRCASQVHFSLRTVTVNSPDELYREMLKLPWEEILQNDSYFSVASHVDHFTVNNPLFVNVKVKDAIVDRIRRETQARPDSGPELDKAVIYLYWKDDKAEIFLDTSGETLAKHGYRKIPGKAPMLEALAAATLLATKWDRQSPLINPMCGSGTIAIEAALLATGRKPGLLRENYAFMHLKGYRKELYSQALTEVRSTVKDVPGLKIIATDILPDAIDISMVNARIAGVEGLIEFGIADFEASPLPQPPGVILMNPEYGERMGETTALEPTYQRIGDFLKKKCKGFTGYVFTGNLELAKKIGLRASKRIEFYSAQLDCRLLEYELYEGTRRTDPRPIS